MAVIAAIVVLRPKPGDGSDGNAFGTGNPAPALVGTTLDGQQLALADLRGRPVVVNFWGPSCIPCRDEFPLFVQQLAAHQADGLAIVGVLMFDPPATARDFVKAYAATWPTVDDADGAIRTAYRAVARPQTYFIDRDGILRGVQVGQLTEADFARGWAQISGPAASAAP
ncbi:MAG: TlpA disulfide reductase family protein [Candidatus Limnocylindrales bacterium]